MDTPPDMEQYMRLRDAMHEDALERTTAVLMEVENLTGAYGDTGDILMSRSAENWITAAGALRAVTSYLNAQQRGVLDEPTWMVRPPLTQQDSA